MGIAIAGTGSYRPRKVVGNDSFEAERFRISTGSKERRHAEPDETSRLMLREASRMALERADVSAADVDLVIAYSGMPDYLYPKDANLLVADLDLNSAAAWTVDTACASFITSMRIASMAIESRQAETVLVSMAMNWIGRGIDQETTDYSSLGDGAAAVVLRRADTGGASSCVERTDPDAFDFVTLESPFATGNTEAIQFSADPRFREYFGDTVLAVAREAIAGAQLSPDEIDAFLPHQVGETLITIWAKKLGLPEERLLHTFGETGNMSAVNIPMILDHGLQTGRIEDGDRLLFFAPGAGVHLAAMVWEVSRS